MESVEEDSQFLLALLNTSSSHLLRPSARSLRLPSSNGAGPSSRLSTVSADLMDDDERYSMQSKDVHLLRLLIGGLPLKLLAVEALFEIFVGITAEFRESGE